MFDRVARWNPIDYLGSAAEAIPIAYQIYGEEAAKGLGKSGGEKPGDPTTIS